MRSRIPPTCPASPDYHHGLSSFEVAKNDNEKNFLAKPPTALIDGASPRLSAVPILNNEKRQRTLQNTRISDGVLFFRASENFPPMNVSDGKPHQTEAQDAPGHAMKVNAGSNAQPFPTTPVGIMSEKVKQSPTKSSRGCGCRRRFSVRDEKPRKQQAGTATKEVSVVRPHTLPPERRHNGSANEGKRLPQLIRAYHERLNRTHFAGLSDREPRCHSVIPLEPSVFDIGNSKNKRRRRMSHHSSEVLSPGPSDELSHSSEKMASNTTRCLSEEDDIDIKHSSSANKRCRRRSDGRFSHPSLDAGSTEQQLLPENSPSPAAVPVCSSAQGESKECRRSSEAPPRESPFGPVEFRLADADVCRSAPSSKEIKLNNREKLQTDQGHDTESGPLRQQPMPMDPHTAVELVLKLWQPLPPASSLLENSKSVRQELRELLATRKQRSETLSTPTPSPSDSECRAFLFECLSAPLPAEEQCGEVPSGFVSAVSEESSWDRKNNEATLCTSVPATSLAVSKTTEPNPFSFTAGLRHEGSPSTSGNETRPRRARRMHNPTPEGLVPPVACGGEFTVTGGGGNAIQTRPAPTVSSAGSPMRKFGIHQAGGSLLIGVEAAVNAPPIRGDKPHGNKAGSNGRPSHVHDTLASSSAYHRHLQLLRSGETFSPAQKSVRFCHAETVSGDRLAFRFDAKAPCNNKGVPTNGRGAKGSSPRQSFLEKEQKFLSSQCRECRRPREVRTAVPLLEQKISRTRKSPHSRSQQMLRGGPRIRHHRGVRRGCGNVLLCHENA